MENKEKYVQLDENHIINIKVLNKAIAEFQLPVIKPVSSLYKNIINLSEEGFITKIKLNKQSFSENFKFLIKQLQNFNYRYQVILKFKDGTERILDNMEISLIDKNGEEITLLFKPEGDKNKEFYGKPVGLFYVWCPIRNCKHNKHYDHITTEYGECQIIISYEARIFLELKRPCDEFDYKVKEVEKDAKSKNIT